MKAESKTLPLVFLSNLFFMLHAYTGAAQKYRSPDEQKQHSITINFDDYTVKTQMLRENRKIEASPEKSYMWIAGQKLMETEGGFAGHLVHGTFRAFYLNNQLREQGEVRFGLREKLWSYWYPTGNLKERITWKRGAKHGKYYLYNDYGQLMAKGSFRNNKLHGWFYTYSNGKEVLEKKKYRDGAEVIVKPRKKRKPAKTGVTT